MVTEISVIGKLDNTIWIKTARGVNLSYAWDVWNSANWTEADKKTISSMFEGLREYDYVLTE